MEYAEPNVKVNLIDEEKISLLTTNEDVDVMQLQKN